MGKTHILSAALIEAMQHDLLYEPDTGIFRWKIVPSFQRRVSYMKEAGHKVTTTGYMDLSWRGSRYKAHRIAWAFIHGPILDASLVIDHINGVKDDNRIENLRLVSGSVNGINRRQYTGASKSGISGIYPNVSTRTGKTTWYAKAVFRKKQIHLGAFKTIQGAIDARAKWLLENDPMGANRG